VVEEDMVEVDVTCGVFGFSDLWTFSGLDGTFSGLDGTFSGLDGTFSGLFSGFSTRADDGTLGGTFGATTTGGGAGSVSMMMGTKQFQFHQTFSF